MLPVIYDHHDITHHRQTLTTSRRGQEERVTEQHLFGGSTFDNWSGATTRGDKSLPPRERTILSSEVMIVTHFAIRPFRKEVSSKCVASVRRCRWCCSMRRRASRWSPLSLRIQNVEIVVILQPESRVPCLAKRAKGWMEHQERDNYNTR
jgi:hypothetical protein